MIEDKRKTAFPESSVAADEEKLSGKNTNTIIAKNSSSGNDLFDRDELDTISLAELYDTIYRRRPPIIEGLLHTGTYILAGAPKIGKSFLVAQIAYHVSTGRPLWGYTVRQSTVLYLALEDDRRRLQERMFTMFGVEEAGDLHFCIASKQVGFGLEDQLEQFLHEHPQTRLIIIDTLQKVREITSDTYSYAKDYEIVGKLKQFADQHDVCLLIVHHTRKQHAGDAFEMISGTNGLLGSADGGLILQKEKRTDRTATMDIVGRDQGDQRLFLMRNEERLIWELDHAETELWKSPPDAILEAIAASIKEEWTGSATDLVQLLEVEMKPNTLTKHLNVTARRLQEEYGILYESTRSHAGRKISLRHL